MKSLQIGILIFAWAAAGGAFAQASAQVADMAPRCWAMHVLQGEHVRAGTPTAQIASENADFWRSQVADQVHDEGRVENVLSATLEATRAEADRMPGHGVMAIVVNASTCQTLRADLQPGYDPVQQNRGN